MRLTFLVVAMLIAGGAHAQAIVGQTSHSNSEANSNSASSSGAISDQQQGQSQGLQNSNANTTTAQQGNQQATHLTFEASTIPTDTTVRWKGNTTVALAAGVSFSSDYCGGTASAGASAAGVSIGAAKPIMDGNCQALRRAEKFGVAAANAYNMGHMALSSKLLAMQVYETCMSGNDADVSMTADACKLLGLVDGDLNHHPANHVAPPSAPAERKASADVTVTGSDGRSTTLPAAATR